MKLVFLASSIDDLRWFKQYYMNVFPEGKEKSQQAILSASESFKDQSLYWPFI